MLIAALAVLIPIIAISGGLYLGYKKMKWQYELKKNVNNKFIEQIIEENKELKQRIRNIEEIITLEDRKLEQ